MGGEEVLVSFHGVFPLQLDEVTGSNGMEQMTSNLEFFSFNACICDVFGEGSWLGVDQEKG